MNTKTQAQMMDSDRTPSWPAPCRYRRAEATDGLSHTTGQPQQPCDTCGAGEGQPCTGIELVGAAALQARAELLVWAARHEGTGDPPYNLVARHVPEAGEAPWQISYDRDDESLSASGPTPEEALAALRRELSGECRVARAAGAVATDFA